MIRLRSAVLVAAVSFALACPALAEPLQPRQMAQADTGPKAEPPRSAPPIPQPAPSEQPVPPPSQLPIGNQPLPANPPRQAAPAQPAPTQPGALTPEYVRLVQSELVRLACSAGMPDGRWSQADQEAVARFNQHGRWNFDPVVPTGALLATLQRQEYRVCPSECQPGFEAQGNTCVAVRAPPARQARPRVERRREPVRRAAPSRQERRAAERERRRERRVERPRRPRATGQRPASGRDARGCRFVPRATGGSFRGDTIEVCD